MKRRQFTLSSLAFFSALATNCHARPIDKSTKEVGPVSWGRDYTKALADSKSSGKPIFLFFQEVPG